MMNWIKLKTAMICGLGVLITVGATVAVVGQHLTSRSVNPSTISTPTASVPVAEPAMTAWKQGQKTEAVQKFVAADWSGRPPFPAGSVLSLSEAQFGKLSDTVRQQKSVEMMAELNLLKQLAAAVVQSAKGAAAKGDAAQAQQAFTALKQAGTALQGPDCLLIVQLVGKAFVKMATQEMKT